MVTNPVEVTDSIVNGTKHILDFAGQCGAKSVVNLSSMEVYGQLDCTGGKRATEEQQGYIDVIRIRSCYPLAKRMAENLCCSYFKEYGIPVKTARLAQTFGQGANPEDTRIFAQFARAVRNGRELVLHTVGNSMGNYCDINDTVEAVLFLLQYGEKDQIYNVVNEANQRNGGTGCR